MLPTRETSISEPTPPPRKPKRSGSHAYPCGRTISLNAQLCEDCALPAWSDYPLPCDDPPDKAA
ncbi:MAG: hypothetical protein NVS1B14_04100 [Vulcanimicrobiaceae bacterium]